MADATTISLAAPPLDLLHGAALFLDFDGTLVDLAPTPERVVVDDRLPRLLTVLSDRLDGRIAIVSGRPVAALRELLPLHLLAVGSHGMEFGKADGSIEIATRPAALETVLARMQRLAAQYTGVLVEDKPLGAALHYRQAPSAELACHELASSLAAEHSLHLQPGRMMIEIRAPGGDKGTAIERLMREPQMHGTRPVFMGDDLTDEPGFTAVQRLGGSGILIGETRATQASFSLHGVAEALSWLEDAAAQLA